MEATIINGVWKGYLGRGLAHKELQYLLSAAQGMTAKQIARQFDVAACTVTKRLSCAMFKLGVTRQTAMIAEAMRRQIISPMCFVLAALIAMQVSASQRPQASAPAGPTALEQTFLGLASLLAGSQQENATLHKAFADIAKALVDRPINVAAPSVTVEGSHIHVPEQPPAAVHLTVPEQPAPVVNVTNDVQPAAVTVNLPDRETTSVIERDMQGNILNVTQVEKTIQ